MILGIGIDLVDISRIENLINKFDEKFINKVFTQHEISSAKKKSALQAVFYAKRFAAKEAFAKSCGLGIGRGINFCDIEIDNNSLGAPFIRLINNKEKFLLEHFKVQKINIHLSLTDEKNSAQAMVLLEA